MVFPLDDFDIAAANANGLDLQYHIVWVPDLRHEPVFQHKLTSAFHHQSFHSRHVVYDLPFIEPEIPVITL